MVENAGSSAPTSHIRLYGAMFSHDLVCHSLFLKAREKSVKLHPVIWTARDRFPGRGSSAQGSSDVLSCGSLTRGAFPRGEFPGGETL